MWPGAGKQVWKIGGFGILVAAAAPKPSRARFRSFLTTNAWSAAVIGIGVARSRSVTLSFLAGRDMQAAFELGIREENELESAFSFVG